MRNRFILIWVIITLFFSLTSYSSIFAREYGMAGCGLGSIIMGNKGKISQLLASYSNGLSWNQTFGMSSGTSNCTEDGIVKKEKIQEIFVYQNYESLEQEMVIGRGEKLDTLAILFGCKNNKEKFSFMTKIHYNKLFMGRKTPSNLVVYINSEIQKDDVLKSSCKN